MPRGKTPKQVHRIPPAARNKQIHREYIANSVLNGVHSVIQINNWNPKDEVPNFETASLSPFLLYEQK